MTTKNPHAQALGKLGGAARSDAKTAACRANGRKGGWPKGTPRPKRYCPPCERYCPSREYECRLCGADTERVPA